MKKFVFEIRERSKGIAVVYAENEEEALEMVESYEGDLLIHDSELDVGGLIEVTDVDNEE